MSSDEISALLRKMKKGRTCAEDGLVAEMLKAGCQELIDAVAQTFTDILRGSSQCPGSWKRGKLVVLF